MEIWKDIKGYNGIYKVSNYGNVVSYVKNTPKALNGHVLPNGYRMIIINYKGQIKKFFLHKLVATYFVDNPNKYSHICHIDGNKLNNNYANLRWCTAEESKTHTVDVSGVKRGTEASKNKLSEEDVIYIYNSDETQRALAKKFGVARSTIHFIKNGDIWGWLTKEVEN